LLATVQVNSQQIGGSNQQAFKALEKSLRDFINNTSWTGKKFRILKKSNVVLPLLLKEMLINSKELLLFRQYALFIIPRMNLLC
jgi:hypothetical protein